MNLLNLMHVLILEVVNLGGNRYQKLWNCEPLAVTLLCSGCRSLEETAAEDPLAVLSVGFHLAVRLAESADLTIQSCK